MSILDSVNNFVNAKPPAKGGFNPLQDTRLTVSGIRITTPGGKNIEQNTYTINFNAWFKSLPYGFRHNMRNGKSIMFYLPLNPQNIQVRTPFATNIMSTLYGTVEEHSEVRYHDIVITGTTGMTPRYSQIFQAGGGGDALQQNQRQSYIDSTFSKRAGALSGFFSKTIGLAQTAASKISGAVSDVNQLLGGQPKPIESGVQEALSGYAAFHNFFRFLLQYKRDAAGLDSQAFRKKHPLQFLNYKDNIQYDCAVRDFSFTKSASDPLLYNYTIVMRCYNLTNIDKIDTESLNNLSERFAQLGLDGVQTSSKFSLIAKTARQATLAAHSLIAAVNGAGG